MFKSFNAVKAVFVTSVLAVASQAHAALPDGAAAAISTMGTDVVSAIGLVIAAGIAIYAVKKLGSKMGWL